MRVGASTAVGSSSLNDDHWPWLEVSTGQADKEGGKIDEGHSRSMSKVNEHGQLTLVVWGDGWADYDYDDLFAFEQRMQPTM